MQGVSTGWAKKVENLSFFSRISRLYVHISQQQLKIEAYKLRIKKLYPSPIEPSHVHVVLQGGPKMSDAIPVFSISPIVLQPATVPVSSQRREVRSICRAQTCAHSVIVIHFGRGVSTRWAKSLKKFRIFDHF